jgi:hypothetical protein
MYRKYQLHMLRDVKFPEKLKKIGNFYLHSFWKFNIPTQYLKFQLQCYRFTFYATYYEKTI